MVQEFHVVRCFSCQTFQVHQVKKSKKWSCKMCGEKQSLIKEYGRGTGADCRRHVQKLNTVRGELLESEHERALAQWDEGEECEVEDNYEAQSCDQKEEVQTVSRWIKYVAQKNSKQDEDEEDEEENVYTERVWGQNKWRKRKRVSKAAESRYTGGKKGDLDVPFCRRNKLPLQLHDESQSQQHLDDHETSAPSGSKAPPLSSALTYSQSQTSSHNSPSFHKHSQSPASSPVKQEVINSKWSRFLTSACVEKEDEEEDGSNAEHAISSNVFVDAGPKKDCVSVSIEKVLGLGKSSQIQSPYCLPGPAVSQTPMCVQPSKKHCPRPAFNALFHTDEDFDDDY